MHARERKALIGVLDALWQGQRLYARAVRSSTDPQCRRVLTWAAKVWDEVIGDLWFKMTGLEADWSTIDLPLLRFRGLFDQVSLMAANDNLRLPLTSLDDADEWAIGTLQLAVTMHATPGTRATLLQCLKKIQGAARGRQSYKRQ